MYRRARRWTVGRLLLVGALVASGLTALAADLVVHPKPAAAATNHQITTFAGGPGTSSTPTAVWGSVQQLARFGNFVYMADWMANVIRRIDVSNANPANWTMTVVAGTGAQSTAGDGGPATAASLNQPNGVAVDSNGDLYIAETSATRVRRVVVSTGLIYTYATGFNNPRHLTFDASNNLYIANNASNRINRVTYSANTASYPLASTVIVGTGVAGSTGDNGPSNQATIGQMYGVAIDSGGNLYIADSQNHVIRRVAAPLDGTGTITTIAGLAATSGNGGDNGPSSSARLNSPTGLSIDASGNLLVADQGNHRVRRIAPPLTGSGTISTVAGTGTGGYQGDGGAATAARLSSPAGVVAGAGADYWISEAGNQLVRYVNATGTISTVAFGGTGTSGGDGGQATAAQFPGINASTANPPMAMAADTTRGFLYVSDYYRVRRITLSTGVITTYAGTMGSRGTAGDGGLATAATLGNITGLAVDQASGDLYLADNANHRIRKITFATGVITKIAGTGGASSSPDGTASGSTTIASPYQIALDGSGNLLVAESGGHKIRRISTPLDGNGMISTVLGSGSACSGAANSCNSATPTAVNLNAPYGVAVAPNGDIFVADTSNHRIRKVSGGVASVVVGTGAATSTGDGGPGYAATTRSPQNVTVDSSGTVFFTESANGGYRVRKLDSSGNVTTVAGTATSQVWGDDGPAGMASFAAPYAMAIDANSNLYVSDTSGRMVRRIQNVAASMAGIISTYAFGPGSGISLANMYLGVRRMLGTGNTLYFLDDTGGTNGGNLRSINVTTNALTHVAGANVNQNSGDGGLATIAGVQGLTNHDGGIARDSNGDIYVASTNSIRKIVVSTGLIYTYATLPSNFSQEIAFDASDNLYVALSASNYIYRIPAGTAQNLWPITVGAAHVFAGTGTACAASSTCGDGGAATSANVSPYGLVINPANGDVFFTDNANGNRVRQIKASDGKVYNYAGNSLGTVGTAGDGGAGTSATLSSPKGLAINSGFLYVADSGNHRVRRIDLSTGFIYAYAGTGTSGSSNGTGVPTAATLNTPTCITFDGSNNAYICDQNKAAVRKVDTSTSCSSGPCITTLFSTTQTGTQGDGGQATNAHPGHTYRLPVAIDRTRNVMYVGTHGAVRRIDIATGVITRYAGTGSSGNSSGDGGLATSATFNSVNGLTVDQTSGDLYISDGHSVRKITFATGVISRLVGTYGAAGSTGDGSPSSGGRVSTPRQLALDSSGNLLIADSGNHKIRRIAPPLNGNGTISTYAGTGSSCSPAGSSACESATPTLIALNSPQGVGIDANNTVYIADTSDFKVYKVTSGGVASVFAGTGANGSTGDGTAATNARVGNVLSVATDPGGNVYLGDSAQNTVRRVDSTGIIATVVGVSGSAVSGFYGDGGVAWVARTSNPVGLDVDSSGNLYVGDPGVARVRRVALPSAETVLSVTSGALTQGQSASIVATVTNNGGWSTSGSTSVVVTLPAGLSYSSGTISGGSCSAAGQVVTCSSSTAVEFNSGTLAATINVAVAANATGPVTISGTVTNASDTNTANNTATDVEPITITNQAPTVTNLANNTGATWTPQVAASISFDTRDVDGNLANFVVCVRRASASCASSGDSVSVARWTVSSSGITADAGNGTWSMNRSSPASPNWASASTITWTFAVTPGKVARAESGWVYQVYATDAQSVVSGWQTLGSTFTMATYMELNTLTTTDFGSLNPQQASGTQSRSASGVLCNTSCTPKLATVGTWTAGALGVTARTDGSTPAGSEFALYCSTNTSPANSASNAVGASAATIQGASAFAANTSASGQSLSFFCGLTNGKTRGGTYSGTVSVSLG